MVAAWKSDTLKRVVLFGYLSSYPGFHRITGLLNMFFKAF